MFLHELGTVPDVARGDAGRDQHFDRPADLIFETMRIGRVHGVVITLVATRIIAAFRLRHLVYILEGALPDGKGH